MIRCTNFDGKCLVRHKKNYSFQQSLKGKKIFHVNLFVNLVTIIKSEKVITMISEVKLDEFNQVNEMETIDSKFTYNHHWKNYLLEPLWSSKNTKEENVWKSINRFIKVLPYFAIIILIICKYSNNFLKTFQLLIIISIIRPNSHTKKRSGNLLRISINLST